MRCAVWLFRRMGGSWPSLLAAGALLGALALSWRVRDAPLLYGGLVRVDALGAWFGVVALAGLLVALAAGRAWPGWRTLALVPLLGSYALGPTLGIAAAYLLFAGLLAAPGQGLARRGLAVLPGLCLLLGYGMLALRGAASYDARTAGAALSSLAFWFVLLAALAPVVGLARADAHLGGAGLLARSLAPAWLYPLARLYSLGPWNAGWSLATLLLAGALACWCALAALLRPDVAGRAAALTAGALAGALAGLGLGTSAGVAAACYGMLIYVLLVAGVAPPGWLARPAAPPVTELEAQLPWLFSSAFPFAAPFAAAWMLIGASMAGGVALLGGALWLSALLAGMAWAVWGAPADAGGLHRVVALASAGLGVGAPLLVRGLIEPATAQLQGGLAPYGDVNIWPWIGLATNDAAHIPVATWPSLALALLMLVLCALVYALARLRASAPPRPPNAPGGPDGVALRDEVPWLALVLGPPARPDEPGHDAE